MLGENTEKCITFSEPIKKEQDKGKTIKCKLNFIDSFRFKSSSLSSLVDKFSEVLHNKKCSKCKSCLEYISIEDNKLDCKFIECSKSYKLHFNKDLI